MGDLVGNNFGRNGVEDYDGGLALRVDGNPQYDSASQTATISFIGSPLAKFNAISGNVDPEVTIVYGDNPVDPDSCPDIKGEDFDISRNSVASIFATNQIDIGVAGVSPALAAEIEAAKCLTVTNDFAQGLLK